MSREFRMPSLGADMEAATLVRWQVSPGAQVHRGDVLALVETEKGLIDIESFDDGVLEKLLIEPGARVPVGTPMALFAGESGVASPAAARPAPGTESTPAAAAPSPPAPVTSLDDRRPRASPAARAQAAALGLDLARVTATGSDNVITLADVTRADAARGAAKSSPPAAEGQTPPAAGGTSGVRHAIAVAMSRSKREIPHYYLQLAMDCRAAVDWLADYNASRPVPERLLMTVLLVKALARAAAEHRDFNGFFGANGFEPATAVNVGVAIAMRGGGLVAPAIHEADRKRLPTLMSELQELVARVRGGHLRSRELASATLTLTSLGDDGVDALFPIIHPPQVAILGCGSMQQRPWAVDGRIEARPVMVLTLAADHRVTDGRDGGKFLARIRDLLSRPDQL